MKKVKIGVSVLVLFVLCFALKKIDLLFSYILALFLHEMAHLFVATRCGYNLKMFRFDLFGMSVDLDAEIDNRDSFAINVGGPLFNLFLAIVCCAMYWLVPESYLYLNAFCFSNISLAIFNLIPIYPLDGGKIFRSFFNSDRVYKIADRVIRLFLSGVFVLLFFFSITREINWFFLLVAVFFLTSRPLSRPTFSIFKSKSKRQLDKALILKVQGENTLYELLRLIKKSHYTIFYFNNIQVSAQAIKKKQKENQSPENGFNNQTKSMKIFIDEDEIINLSLNYPLTTKIKEIYQNPLTKGENFANISSVVPH